MTRNPRSTSIAVLRSAAISRMERKSSICGPAFQAVGRQNARASEESEPVRNGEVVVAAGLLSWPAWPKRSLEAIKDLVGPEPLEAMQRLVERRELLVRDAADLFDGLDVLLVERIDDAADFLALCGQANANRTAIDPRALMVE